MLVGRVCLFQGLKFDSLSANFDGLVYPELCFGLNGVLQVDGGIKSFGLVGL